MARSLSQAVSAYIAGDVAAFNEVYSLVYRTVFVAAKVLMKNEHDAEDVTQDVFIKAYKELANLKNPETANAWFRTVTRNTCLNKLRKRGEVLLGEDEEYIMDNQAQTHESLKPESAYITKERNAVLMEMVEELPLEQRETVLYYYIQDLSVTNIAALLECSAGTIKSRLNYARKKLRLLAQEREKQGIKLYGFSFIPFLGFLLRYAASKTPLSSTTASTILETATGVSGVAEGVGAAGGGATGAVGGTATAATATGTTGVVGATGVTAATVVTSQAAVSSFIGFGGFMAIVGPKLAAAVIALFVGLSAASVGLPMAFAEISEPSVPQQIAVVEPSQTEPEQQGNLTTPRTEPSPVAPVVDEDNETDTENRYVNTEIKTTVRAMFGTGGAHHPNITNMETWYQDGELYLRAIIYQSCPDCIVQNLAVNFKLEQSGSDEIIAQHDFGYLPGNMEFPYETPVEWIFVFPKASVNTPNADLRELETYYITLGSTVENNHETREREGGYDGAPPPSLHRAADRSSSIADKEPHDPTTCPECIFLHELLGWARG